VGDVLGVLGGVKLFVRVATSSETALARRTGLTGELVVEVRLGVAFLTRDRVALRLGRYAIARCSSLASRLPVRDGLGSFERGTRRRCASTLRGGCDR